MSNYRPVSLLSDCGEIFERPNFSDLCNYLEENKLVSECQSGLRPHSLCVSQLL